MLSQYLRNRKPTALAVGSSHHQSSKLKIESLDEVRYCILLTFKKIEEKEDMGEYYYNNGIHYINIDSRQSKLSIILTMVHEFFHFIIDILRFNNKNVVFGNTKHSIMDNLDKNEEAICEKAELGIKKIFGSWSRFEKILISKKREKK